MLYVFFVYYLKKLKYINCKHIVLYLKHNSIKDEFLKLEMLYSFWTFVYKKKNFCQSNRNQITVFIVNNNSTLIY